MVGIAQTGTGKTIAFAIPMLQRLAALAGKGLVLVPTRELALQVNEVFRKFAPLMGMQTSVIIGGESASRQQQDLRKKPRVIVATPGRLLDHMQQRTVRLDDARVLVLDEADRMFDMGFAPQINRILAAVPRDRQTMLFSATMPDGIMRLAAAQMKLPLRVEVARPGAAVEKTKQEVFMVTKSEKAALLSTILGQYGGSVLLFVRTKRSAHRIVQNIRESGHTAAEIHSNRSLNQRREALDGFKSGRYRVLVATDIAARGIDVIGIELVINYDLPDENENYVHRIGRTGRAGRPGHAISFATPDQRGEVQSIERLLRTIIPVSALPKLAAPVTAPAKPKQEAAQPGPAPRASQPPRRDPAGARAEGHFTHRPPRQQDQPRAFSGEAKARDHHDTGRRDAPYRRQGGNFRFTAPGTRHFGQGNRAERPAYHPANPGTGPKPRPAQADPRGGRTPGQELTPQNFQGRAPFARPPKYGPGPAAASRRPGGTRIEVSPYFEEPRRYGGPRGPLQDPRHSHGGPSAHMRPGRGVRPGRRYGAQHPGRGQQEQKKKPAPVSWFARFMKKRENEDRV